MKVLYITNSLNMSGGLERMLSLITSHIVEKYQINATILTLNDGHINPYYSIHPNIQLLSINCSGNPFKYYNKYMNGIKKTIKKTKPDVIQVWDDGIKGLTIPMFAKTNAKLFYYRRVSLLVDMQHDFSWIKKQYIKIKWKIMQQLAKKYDGLVVLTNNTKKEWPGVKNFNVIPNPLNFYPKESSNLENKNVIAVGRHAYQKGYDRLLDAWKLIHHENNGWVLNIFGHSYDKNYLPNLIKERKLENSIQLFEPVKNIEQKYLESSIFVLGSRYEGFGNVIVEAMACGLPVISFDCPFGPSEIIKDQEDGFLIEDNNIKMFADKLNLLIKDKQLRIQMGKNVKENVKVYELESIASKHYQVMIDAIN